jgi:predicted nucleic acid-binding protein
VKVLFDTNVLVAALVENHGNHSVCSPWLERAQTEAIEAFLSTHTLAELYAILTRLPLKNRITPDLALHLIRSNLAKFKLVSLTVEDYRSVLLRMIQSSVIGGGIYDGLIAQAALKAKVDVLLTSNSKDFTRLGEDVARLVQVPG